ncbi:O-antigen ligase [uncultured Aquimarina sp.]|uniref:O-antigen ligase family protein n=1 Tax=uncultured Aquimarina sp. TaxID=575652 RepID=UPI0026138EB5|nr:O-antigen ligase family protein [uncultured Aquimarina sp.]
MRESYRLHILTSLVIVFFINMLSYFFIYDKEFVQGSIEIDISSQEPTDYWIVYKEFFNEKRVLSPRKKLAGKSRSIIVNIPENIDIEYAAIAWIGVKDQAFTINEIKISNDRKTKIIDDPHKLVDYNSVGAKAQLLNNEMVITSLMDGNRWVMLKNNEVINKIRRVKKRSILPWYGNVLIFISILIYFLYSDRSELTIKEIFSYKNARGILLIIWMLLFPFWPVSSTLFLGVGVFLFLIHLKTYTKKDIFLEVKKYYWPLFVFFIVQVIKFLMLDFSANEGERVVDTLVILLMPFCFMFITEKMLKFILDATKISVAIYTIAFLITSVDIYYSKGILTGFSEFVTLRFNYFWHSSYYGGLILMIFLTDFFSLKKLDIKHLALYIILVLFIYLTKARIAMLLSFSGVFLIVLKNLKFSKKQLIFVFISSFILISSVAIYEKEYLKSKVEQLVKNEARSFIWESSIKSIKEKPVFGHGSSNVQKEVFKNIRPDKNLKFREYNSHNQFLETLTGMGIIGLLSLLLILVYPFKVANNKFIMSYCVLITVLFIFESFISRQAGINLFVFWYCLFLNYKMNKD